MVKENHLSYEEVVNMANFLHAEGKRVTLEYLRRKLGRGTHTQIALFLNKWQQSQKLHKTNTNRTKKALIKSDANSTLTPSHSFVRSNYHLRSIQSKIIYKDHYARKKRNIAKDFYIKKEKKITENKKRSGILASFTMKKSFSIERLKQETPIVKSLFWALYQIKCIRLNTLEAQQKIESNLLILRMKHESGVHQIKQKNHAKIKALLAEFNQFKASSDRKIRVLRQKLTL